MDAIDTIAVTTADERADLLAANNSAAWALNYEKRGPALKWLVLMRNAGAGLRHPFLLCPIERITYRPDSFDKRKKYSIEFCQFADLSDDDAKPYSPGTQNPVAFKPLTTFLKRNPKDLTFQTVPEKTLPYSYSRRVGEVRSSAGLTIAEAKRLLAHSLGVPMENIEITIRA